MEYRSGACVRSAGLALLLLAAFPPAVRAAEATAPLAHGQRVRLTLTMARSAPKVAAAAVPGIERGATVVGRFRGWVGDSLLVDPEDMSRSVAIPAEAVLRAEVSRGRHGHAGNGALIGLVSGAVAGAAVGFIVCESEDCDLGTGDDRGLVATVLGAGGAVVGLGVGALIGSQIHGEDWDAASLDRGEVGFRISEGGDVFVALRFSLP